MESQNPKRPGIALIVILLVSIAGFWSIDVFLARLESSELRSQARRFFEDGTRLLNAGQASLAVDPLRKAYALDRTDRTFDLRLAEALLASDKLDDAQRTLTEGLERLPNDGETNLIEARLMVREGKYDEASAYYHRALYGTWEKGAQAQQLAVRVELARMLAAHGSQKDLLAELLPLESDAASNLPVLQQVARFYVIAGSPARAQTVYQNLIHNGAGNAETFAGLGNAELAMGDYRAAQVDFDEAMRNGASADLKPRVDLAGEMARLDPTVRRLSSTEKFARSLRILRAARDALAACGRATGGKDMLDSADKVLAQKTVRNVNNELAEERLSMAERLWAARVEACGPSTSPQEESLRLIMVKLAQ
jgi:tetratricopeptide (TPR) repeat protein